MRWTKVALAFGLVAALTSCGSSSSKSSSAANPPTTTGAQPALIGTNWVLASYRAAAGLTDAAAGAPATLLFAADGTLSGSTGCNTFGGTYSSQEATLRITMGAMTQVACTGAAGAQEQAIVETLPEVTSYRVGAGALQLLQSTNAVLVYNKGTTGLSGTWNVTGVNNGQQAVASTSATEKLTASF